MREPEPQTHAAPDRAPLDDVVRAALVQILDGAPAERVLTRVLRAHRTLDNEGRRRVATRMLGVACLRLRLAYLVEREEGAVSADALLSMYERTIESPFDDDTVVWPADPIARLSVQRSLPMWVAHLFVDEHGIARADALAAAMNTPGPVTLRANVHRQSRDALRARLHAEGIVTEPVRQARDGLHIVGRANLFGSAAWRDGGFEVQDEGSQLVVEAAGVQPGMRVLDLCAGRGGKTIALASQMRDEGRVDAYDVDARALRDLAPRIQRAGLRSVRTVDAPDGAYDVVVVDAPCSSLGTLRRAPDRRFQIEPRQLSDLPPVQRSILERGLAHCKVGGRLLYATCTLHRGENEHVADTFERTHDVEPVSVRRTLFPHIDGTDGFFFSAWLRRS